MKYDIKKYSADIGQLQLCLNPSEPEIYSQGNDRPMAPLKAGMHLTLFNYPATAISSSIEEWIEENTADIEQLASFYRGIDANGEGIWRWEEIEECCDRLHESFCLATWPNGPVKYLS